MISKYNLPNHELIGLEVEIVDSKNKTLVGMKGRIIDETKNTFTIRSDGKERKIIKKDSTFVFKVGRKKFMIKGERLVGNPWERLKRRIKVKNRWEKL